MAQPDAPPSTCQPQSATGEFYRRTPNPRIISGAVSFTDSMQDTAIADPDLRWDEANQQWVLFFGSPHGAFDSAGPTIIRRATSVDLASWTHDDAPTLQVGAAQDWDSAQIGAPSVAYNPDAAPDRRYMMVYSGAAQAFPFPGYSFPEYAIGVAFSADGISFTRLPANESPKSKAGLVLVGTDAHPGATGTIVTDPEVVFVAGTYYLWFSTFACSGTDCATVTAKGIGHATSTDGVHWNIDAAPVLTLSRQSADPTSGGTKPAVIYDDLHCRWELWLTNDGSSELSSQSVDLDNTAGVWRATSSDATSWTVNYNGTRDFAWDAAASGEHLGLRSGIEVARKNNGRYMVYVGFDDQSVPVGSTLPSRTDPQNTVSGVSTLNLATRDAQ